LSAFGLLDRVQVGDTGPAESTRRGNLQRVGLLFLGSRDSQNYNGHKCGTGRKRPNSCDLRAQELSSATKDSDGRKQAALQKLLAHNTTGSATEAVGARYDRQYGSCRRAIRPAPDTEAVCTRCDRRAIWKLSARDTTGDFCAANSVL